MNLFQFDLQSRKNYKLMKIDQLFFSNMLLELELTLAFILNHIECQ